MVDAIRQRLVPGDIIFNKYELGVVYGETPSGQVRYYHFRTVTLWRENQVPPQGVEVFNVGGTNRIFIQEIPIKAYTRDSDTYFKLSDEQIENFFDTMTFFNHIERNFVRIERLSELLKEKTLMLKEQI